MAKLVESRIPIPFEEYATLASRPRAVREYVAAASSAMEDLASGEGRRITETPRLVDQRDTGLGVVELVFQAETRPR